MRYISLDLETTCLTPSPEHILQVSMIVEDTKEKHIPVESLPNLTFFIKHDEIKGSAYALSMNGWILDFISGRANNCPYPIYSLEEATEEMNEFIGMNFGNRKAIAAGKNVAGFDLPFLPKEVRSKFIHRVIDPGSMFIDFSKDLTPPDYKECMARAGVSGDVSHDAYEDAKDIIKILRTKY